MKRLIVKNIGLLAGIGHEGKLCLKGKEMTELNTLSDAYLIIEDRHFADYGKMSNCPSVSDNEEVVDAINRINQSQSGLGPSRKDERSLCSSN